MPGGGRFLAARRRPEPRKSPLIRAILRAISRPRRVGCPRRVPGRVARWCPPVPRASGALGLLVCRFFVTRGNGAGAERAQTRTPGRGRSSPVVRSLRGHTRKDREAQTARAADRGEGRRAAGGLLLLVARKIWIASLMDSYRASPARLA
jgi:hypothetical protein